MTKDHQSTRSYFASWSASLTAKSSLVRDLIGDAHWLSDGHHKEYLIREFLSEYLPSGIDLSSGFIKPPRPDLSCSKELDVMIFDSTKYTSFFSQGGLAIVEPAAVIAHIESKTTFNKKELSMSFINISSSRTIYNRFVNTEDTLWSGVCFFNAGRKSLKSIASACP